MVATELAVQMRRRLLIALGHETVAITPAEQRVWSLYQRWQQTEQGADYRAFKVLAAACPHAQIEVYRQEATNGALIVYLRCKSCNENPFGVGVAIPHSIVRGCGIDPWFLPEHGQRAPDYEVCAHCRERKPGEVHHFAPKVRFHDADNWPTAYLCNDCHQLWHDVMGWGSEPWARTEAQVLAERERKALGRERQPW